MTWYWYIARYDEILIDLDCRDHNGLGRVEMFRRRLKALIIRNRFDRYTIESVWLYPSMNQAGYHAVIHLGAPLSAMERAILALRLGSDIHRGLCTLQRIIERHGAPDLLIASHKWPGFYREPDQRCDCEEKHTATVMAKCPVALAIRPSFASFDFFGQSETGPGAIKLNFGRVNIETIMETSPNV